MVFRVALTVLVAANRCSPGGAAVDLPSAPSAGATASVDAEMADEAAPLPPPDKDEPSDSTRDALFLAGATPETFVLELDLDRRTEIDALALFQEGRFECKDRLHVGVCDIRGRSRLELGDLALVTLLVRASWEHEGRSYSEESVAIVTLSPRAKVVHTLMQWKSKVDDCDSTLRIRRWAAAQTKDGRDLLCIESVDEEGVGLFDVMRDEQAGRPWRALERTRSIEPFVWGAEQEALLRSPDDQAACPKTGYSQLVPVARRGGLFETRIGVQGDAQRAACPKTIHHDCEIPRCKGKSQPRLATD